MNDWAHSGDGETTIRRLAVSTPPVAAGRKPRPGLKQILKALEGLSNDQVAAGRKPRPGLKLAYCAHMPVLQRSQQGENPDRD